MSEECSDTERTIYLLYAKAYSDKNENDTVTKATVKSHLPKEWKEKADEINDYLKENDCLIPTTKDGKIRTKDGDPIKSDSRFSLTKDGKDLLLEGLKKIDYQFTSVKGSKVLNALLDCLKTIAVQTERVKEMPQEEFEKNFIQEFIEDKKEHISHRVDRICQNFAERYEMTLNQVSKQFRKMKRDGKVVTGFERSSGETVELIVKFTG